MAPAINQASSEFTSATVGNGRQEFAPANPHELTRWAGPDAGPPSPAVSPDPSRDDPRVLSAVAASGLAARLLGPAAATTTWTLTSSTTAAAVVDGRRYVVVDETDPHGWFTSLGLYEVTSCGACGGEHQIPVPPTGTSSPARTGRTRPHLELAAVPTRPGSLGGVPATNPSRKEAGRTCPAAD
jgi:hypothetical protein